MATSYSQAVPLGFEPAQNGLPSKNGDLPPEANSLPGPLPSAPPGYEDAGLDDG